MKKIAVIGGGWYGCHIALFLKLRGYDVTIFESADDIFKGISGKYGIKLHVGPHYPRSEKTQKGCREGYEEFMETYPDLLVEHAFSIYVLGTLDANHEPLKIDLETFRAVGRGFKISREIDPKKWGISNLQGAIDTKEPSILIGNLLREKFRAYLQKAGVKVIRNFNVQELRRKTDKTLVIGNFCCGVFDYAVNTTSYQALLPPEPRLPFELDITYQPCLALVYEDRASKVMCLPPFSFVVMGDWSSCIMPYIEDKEDLAATGSGHRKYIVTHGKHTIMGSFKTAEEAKACLEKIDEKFITTQVQPRCEAEMERFWRAFGTRMPYSSEHRFKYVGWEGAVLAKIKTSREFGSAVTFARDGVVYVIPGKVSNIFEAARETASLINGHNVLQQGAYQFVKNGVLHDVGAITVEKEATPPESMQGPSPKPEPSVKWLSRRDVIHTPELKRPDSASFFQSPLENPKTSSIIETDGYKTQIRSSL